MAIVSMTASVAAPAFAALGEDVASVQADQAHMKAALRIRPGQAYAIHELQQNSGTVVKEFISPTGKVFAITWTGPFVPDLRQLLGAHFEAYSQAAQSRIRRPGRAPLNLQQDGLVVESGGHMRAFFGKAYLSDKLPEGVTANDIH